MTKYREIIRLAGMGLSQNVIASSAGVSKKTVNKVLKIAREMGITWPLKPEETDEMLGERMFPGNAGNKPPPLMPDLERIHIDLLSGKISRKQLWASYCEQCAAAGEGALSYSRFCHHIQQFEEQQRPSSDPHLKPGERVVAGWIKAPMAITHSDSGKKEKVYVFVGMLSYSQFVYAEAFTDRKFTTWIAAHVNMFEGFEGVPKVLVEDHSKDALLAGKDYHGEHDETMFRTLMEQYGCAVVPSKALSSPEGKDEGTNRSDPLDVVCTKIIESVNSGQYASLSHFNAGIQQILLDFRRQPLSSGQTREQIFHADELRYLGRLPEERFELPEWKTATVQYNQHIVFQGMYYSVPYQYGKVTVDLMATKDHVTIYLNGEVIASHCRLYGRKSQYSTVAEHMPPTGDTGPNSPPAFRARASQIGENTRAVIETVLSSRPVVQQTYRSCIGILKLAESYSPARLEKACGIVLDRPGYTGYAAIKHVLDSGLDLQLP